MDYKQNSDSWKILIVSSHTGGGHRSAALALEDMCKSFGIKDTTIVNALEEASLITRFFVFIYNTLLRHSQKYMYLYFYLIEKFSLHNSKIVFNLTKKFGIKLVSKIMPNAIISVHPMTQHYFVSILKELNLENKIPIFTILTDPCRGFWKGWASEGIEKYFVPTHSARDQLIEFGVVASRIVVLGMPIHSRFMPLSSESEKKTLKTSLNLNNNFFTVLVSAGWIGGGNIPKLFHALAQRNLKNCQLILITGRNKKLHEKIQKSVKTYKTPVHIVGFTDKMETYMQASDIMITKLGGLTTFEALSCELPIFVDCVTPPMPQEKNTLKFLEQHGAGKAIFSAEHLVNEIENLIQTPLAYQKLKSATQSISSVSASRSIIKNINEYLTMKNQNNNKIES